MSFVECATKFAMYVVSIGLSDAVEYYTNPDVHRYHNAPDIMRKEWEYYTVIDAFLSGVICCWIMVIPMLLFIVLGTPIYGIEKICIANVLIPIICYLFDLQAIDIYLPHKMLYLMGAIYFVAMIAIQAIKIGNVL